MQQLFNMDIKKNPDTRNLINNFFSINARYGTLVAKLFLFITLISLLI